MTRADLYDEHIRPLESFSPGDEVFVESDVPSDVLDDSTDETERATRIFWRAVIVAGHESVVRPNGLARRIANPLRHEANRTSQE